jgi:hypothetical protein
MDSASSTPNSIPAATSGSRSKLLSTNFKNFLSKPALKHPQKALTVQLWNAEQKSNPTGNSPPPRLAARQRKGEMSTSAGGQAMGDIVSSKNSGFPKTSDAPGEQFEPRQTATSEDYEPDPSKSLKLSPQRQALVDDIRQAPTQSQPRKEKQRVNTTIPRSSPSTPANRPLNA